MTKKIIAIIIFFYNLSFGQNAIDFYFSSQALSEKNNFQKALTEIDKAIALQPDNKEFLMQKSRILYKSGDYQKAKNFLLINRNKMPEEANLLLAKIYALLKNPDSAVFFLQKYLKNHKKISRSKIKLDSAFASLAQTPQWKKLWQKKWYSGRDLAYSEIEFLIENQKLTEALEQTNELLAKNKNDHYALYLKGKIFDKLDNHKIAVKLFTKAIKIYSLNPSYFLARARSYYAIKKHQKAADDLKKSLKLNPYQIKIYPFLAENLLLAGAYDEALNALTYYLKLYPEDMSANFLVAKIYYTKGDYLQALAILNKIFDNYPEKAEIYRLRGLVYYQTHSYEQAYYDLSQALDLNPQMSDIYVDRGLVLWEAGKKQEACNDWKTALDKQQYKANKYYYERCGEVHKNK